MDSDIADALTKEFGTTLTRLAAIVEAIRDEDWATGPTPRETPVHQVCHAVGVILRYANVDVDRKDINICWKPQSAYPSRQRLLKLIDVAREAMGSHIADTTEKTLANSSWRVPPLHKLVYLLRHSVWHLCSLFEELRRRGYRMSSHYTKTWQWSATPTDSKRS
jgi:hypothetical protein